MTRFSCSLRPSLKSWNYISYYTRRIRSISQINLNLYHICWATFIILQQHCQNFPMRKPNLKELEIRCELLPCYAFLQAIVFDLPASCPRQELRQFLASMLRYYALLPSLHMIPCTWFTSAYALAAQLPKQSINIQSYVEILMEQWLAKELGYSSWPAWPALHPSRPAKLLQLAYFISYHGIK